MTDSIFPYPGGKANLSEWIISNFAEHGCYVEPFSGSAAVFFNKPESKVEVINDLDGDIVHFFTTLRDSPDELQEWLQTTPYSRELYDSYADEYYAGVRPDDDVERAGRFIYLRLTQFSGRVQRRGNMAFSKVPEFNPAKRLSNKADAITTFAERFRNVQIECEDYADVIDRYDSDRTFFYCDPPYVEEGDDLYGHGEFDHSEFVDVVSDVQGKVAVSYLDMPPGFDGWEVLEHESPQSMTRGVDDKRETATERLILNYEPSETPTFSSASQATLTGAADL